MNPLENVYELSSSNPYATGASDSEYRVEVRKSGYNPMRRATMHNVTVFVSGTDIVVARTQTTSGKESYTTPAAIDALFRQAKVVL